MAGRRKRLKSSVAVAAVGVDGSSVSVGAVPDLMGTFEAEEIGSNARGECGRYDSCSFSSRCSLRIVHEVVSMLDSKKRELVRSIGFEGILYFPSIKQSNRPFAMWLMSSVDEDGCKLKIGDHISIPFNKFDVGYVLGIPYSGKPILKNRVNSKVSKEKVVKNFLSESSWEHRSMKSFQEVIVRDYQSPMSKKEEDNFKVAFTVFIVSNLLSPSAKHDYASIEYWEALQDPDDLGSFDWAEFVLCNLLEAVRKLKQDASNGIKFPNMTGCVIFLQVLYLDSLDLEGFVMDHRHLPRVRQFSQDKIRAMIAADSNFTRHVSGNHDVGVVTLRDPARCIYSWAVGFDCLSAESRSGRLLAIWETTVAMVHLLKIPLESAGPLFVAAADFQEQVNSGLFVNGTEAVKFMSVLVSIMLPYCRGHRRQPSQSYDTFNPGFGAVEQSISNGLNFLSQPIRLKAKKFCNTVITCRSGSSDCAGSSSDTRHEKNGQVACSGKKVASPEDRFCLSSDAIGDHVQNSFNRVMAGLDGMMHSYLDVDLRVTTAMSNYYLLMRSLKPVCGFDLNSFDSAAESDTASLSCAPSSGSMDIPSPWDIGYSWPGHVDGLARTSDQLTCLDSDESMVIIHRHPRYIQVAAEDLRVQMSGSAELEVDLFDAHVRTIRHEDDELYCAYGNMRWRYLFESDFMEAILGGSFVCLENALSEHLSITRHLYDLRSCKLMFFPALVQSTWVCFAWSIDRNVIYVFEPSFVGPVPERRLLLLERCCYRLKLAMQSFAESVEQGWSHQCTSADMVLISPLEVPSPPLNRTGALCLYFCRCFDGMELKLRGKWVGMERIYDKLLYDLLRFKGFCSNGRLGQGV